MHAGDSPDSKNIPKTETAARRRRQKRVTTRAFKNALVLSFNRDHTRNQTMQMYGKLFRDFPLIVQVGKCNIMSPVFKHGLCPPLGMIQVD